MTTQQTSRAWPILRNLGLLGAIAALGTLNWTIWTTPIEIRPIALDSAASTGLDISSNVPGTTHGFRGPRNYTETLARPIFRADRKPFVAAVEAPPPVVEETVEAAPAAKPIEPPQGLKLVGVMRDGEGQDRALVKSAQSPAASWLRIGDEIDGWRVSGISGSAVILSADTASVTLDLYPVAANQAGTTAP
jgi:hypothetical protein